jgi:hypothetical protein
MYQWLSGRASTLFQAQSGVSSAGMTERSVRTEVIVQRETTTLLIAGATTGLDPCPLCGQKPARAEHARPHLQECVQQRLGAVRPTEVSVRKNKTR